MQIWDLLLYSLALLGSFVFLSIGAWSTGYLTLKLRRGELKIDELPEWLRAFGTKAIRQDETGNKLQMVAPYISMIIGLLIIGSLMVISVVSWYRHGFNQAIIAEGIALLVWCSIIRWLLRLGQ